MGVDSHVTPVHARNSSETTELGAVQNFGRKTAAMRLTDTYISRKQAGQFQFLQQTVHEYNVPETKQQVRA
jgi:hypothetical protein